MKLIKIEAWATPGYHTNLRRYYTNPDIEHTVSLYTDKVETYLYKDGIYEVFKTGIHHLTKPL